MGAFLSEWGQAIATTMAILAILIFAEWRDHHDGLYEDDTDEPDPYADLTMYEETNYEDETYGWEEHNPYV